VADESIQIHHIYKYGKWEELMLHTDELLDMLIARETLLKYKPEGTIAVNVTYTDDETVEMSVGDIECELEAVGDRIYELTRLDIDMEAHRGPQS